MKHILLVILFTLGVWGQEVGVPYISKQPFGFKNTKYSDDQKYFINDNVLYYAESFRSIRRIDDLSCKGQVKGFHSLEELYMSCDENTTYQHNLKTGKSTKIDHYNDNKEQIKNLTDFNLSEIVKNKMLMSSDKKYVIFNKRNPVSNHTKFYIWDIKQKNYLDIDVKAFSSVQFPIFSHYGSKVAFYNLKSETLHIYDIEKRQFIFSLENQKVGRYYFSDDDKYLIKTSLSDVYIYSLDSNDSCVLKNPIQTVLIDSVSLNSKAEGQIVKDGLVGKFNLNECKVKTIEYSEIREFKDVISPEKQHYYRVYRNGRITAWSLHPFQKLYENHINHEVPIGRISISDDGKRLFIPVQKKDRNSSQSYQYGDNGLVVFHTENNRQISWIPLESPVFKTVFKDNSVYILTDEQVLRRYEANMFNEVQKIEFNETKVLRMTFGPGGDAKIGDTLKGSASGLDISGDGKKLIAYFSESILILDIDTFNVLKSIQLNETLRYHYFDEDKKILYYNNRFRIDLNTLEVSQYTDDPYVVSEEERIKNWFRNFYGITPSINDRFVVKLSQFIDVKSEKVLATLYEYPDGEWVIITPEGYFDASYNGRKYLNILTSPFETKIIDDATFRKFHKKINVGE